MVKTKYRARKIPEIIGGADAELEDLLPPDMLAKVMDQILRNEQIKEDFSDTLEGCKPVVGQVEAYAKNIIWLLKRIGGSISLPCSKHSGQKSKVGKGCRA